MKKKTESQAKKSRLNIYLIKKEFTTDEQIINEGNEVEKIEKIGNLYYGKSYVKEPKWIKTFFGTTFDNTKVIKKGISKKQVQPQKKIFNASANAVLIIQSTIGKKERIFAVTFGYGRFLLKTGVYEERFGLKVALNAVNPNTIRSIHKKKMSSIPKHSIEQMTKVGPVSNFGINFEQELINTITGMTTKVNRSLGLTITGKDAFSTSIKVDHNNIISLLENCYKKYKSNYYKKKFDFIDRIVEENNSKVIDGLNNKLIKEIKKDRPKKITMTLPEIIAWDDVSEFKYGRNHSFDDDINLSTFLGFLSADEIKELSLETLKKKEISCISASAGADLPIHKWKIYNCLYFEIVQKDALYLLDNGKWYKIKKDYAKHVIKVFSKFDKSDLKLPPRVKQEHEEDYNKRVAEEREDLHCLDKKLINIGSAKSPIEFCDLYTQKGEIIHVKRYKKGSADLSHLFSQAVISAKLFISDQEFRKKLNKILPTGYKLTSPTDRPMSNEYTIIFAIIKKFNQNDELDLPFFAKLNIKIAKEMLEDLYYKVKLQPILDEEK